MKIILISAKAEHGKNTFANILEEQLKQQGKSVLQIAYADDLKHIAKTYFGWDGNKDANGRYLIQNLGTNRVRENLNRPSYWVDRLCDILHITEGMYEYILVPDTRFVNEIELPKERFKSVITVRIDRPYHKSILTEQQLKHTSETALDDYSFDYYVKNTTLQSLERQAIDLINKF